MYMYMYMYMELVLRVPDLFLLAEQMTLELVDNVAPHLPEHLPLTLMVSRSSCAPSPPWPAHHHPVGGGGGRGEEKGGRGRDGRGGRVG